MTRQHCTSPVGWERLTSSSSCCIVVPLPTLPPLQVTPRFTWPPAKDTKMSPPCCWRTVLHFLPPQRWRGLPDSQHLYDSKKSSAHFLNFDFPFLSQNGYTPLHIAAKKNQMDIGTTLLEYGADTNAATRQGISPIHLAAQEGSVDLVSLLLAKNANVNVCNKMGYTPLHVACHYGNPKMANFLLQNHAKVNAKTKVNKPPQCRSHYQSKFKGFCTSLSCMNTVSQQGHTHIINLLLQHGASANELTVSASEKHKINIPETINEFLDMSDDEGM
ncbi:hypothetical protein GOODEAATRI_002646 [Goodea atripinnis]|uniref:Uncharacterized protein n=1 Tax=Goodea atripinnis TaxID=208336 RepID=A0ABV0N8Q4_9TELE